MVNLKSQEMNTEEENHSFNSGVNYWHNRFMLLDLAKQALERETWSFAFLDEPIG